MIPNLFEQGGISVTSEAQEAMAQALRRHQRRIGELIGGVRQRAGALLDIRIDAEVDTDGVEPPTLRAWVTDGRTETIAGLSAIWVEPLLPARWRRTRWERQLREETEAIVVRNAEALRWSLRQGVLDAVRRFVDDLDGQLESAIEAIRNAMNEVRKRQNETTGTQEGAALAQERLATDFARIEQSLRALSSTGAPSFGDYSLDKTGAGRVCGYRVTGRLKGAVPHTRGARPH
jgi:hypothetical protein